MVAGSGEITRMVTDWVDSLAAGTTNTGDWNWIDLPPLIVKRQHWCRPEPRRIPRRSWDLVKPTGRPVSPRRNRARSRVGGKTAARRMA